MASVYLVPAELLVKRVAEELKNYDAVSPPEWAPNVKTGVSREKPPEEIDWWYTRVASILRKIAMKGPIGVARLRNYYGGTKNRGTSPHNFFPGSGSIVRKSLQKLEKAGLVKQIKGKGRVTTSQGVSFLERVAYQIKQEIPELSKYE
ncbi:MAG: 30S ribosomal protein S19e [Promethearchaeota archaeon]